MKSELSLFLRSIATPQIKRQAALAFALSFLSAAVLLAQPLLVAGLIRDIAAGALAPRALPQTLALLCGAMLSSALLSRALAACHNRLLQAARCGAKQKLYAFILSRDSAFFQTHNEGKLESALETAALAARSIIYDSIAVLAQILIFIILAAALLFCSAPLFGALFLAAALLYLYLSCRMAQRGDKAVARAVESSLAAAARGSDVFANHETISLCGTAEAELQQLDALLRAEQSHYRAAQAKIDSNDFYQRLYLALLFSFFILATGFIAGGSPAAAILFYLIGLLAYSRLDSTGAALNGLFEMAHRLRGALRILGYAPQPAAVLPAPAVIHGHQPAAELENVSFSYHREKPLIENLSLLVEPGEHILISGPSGAGKSTVLRLMAGQLSPPSGAARLSGFNAAALPAAKRAEILSFVSQHAPVFDRTLQENTAYAAPNAAREQIEEILLALGLGHLRHSSAENAAGDWLMRSLGKNGLSLSGGERQRILLARAILRNRPLMILDEAMSALDAEAEKQAFAALRRFCPQAAIVAVAHHRHEAMAGWRAVNFPQRGDKAEFKQQEPTG